MKRARQTCGGFTLIEVLVALAIVTIGMAAVLGTLSSSADTVSYLRDKTFAQWVGLNQIANLRLSGQVAPTGNSEGDTDFAGRKWHWRQEVAATQIPGVVAQVPAGNRSIGTAQQTGAGDNRSSHSRWLSPPIFTMPGMARH